MSFEQGREGISEGRVYLVVDRSSWAVALCRVDAPGGLEPNRVGLGCFGVVRRRSHGKQRDGLLEKSGWTIPHLRIIGCLVVWWEG
ncbi:MAG: hypothetical protein KatS3mg109_1066 [Pirellulaceae bacterium]|nr:MAG: hypothetical protein KatS3mg109_1066 [Pirellulaceae bacterium]